MSCTAFALMNLDLIAVALPGDAAQGGSLQIDYALQRSAGAPINNRPDELGMKTVDPLAQLMGGPLPALPVFERANS
jgi:hypothetical protein